MKIIRKAIDCKLIEESKTSVGYFKYQITIQEIDGTINIVPAYGKDMEDAISRLLWTERTQHKAFNTTLISVLFSLLFVPVIIGAITNNYIWVLTSLFLTICFGFGVMKFDKYINK